MRSSASGGVAPSVSTERAALRVATRDDAAASSGLWQRVAKLIEGRPPEALAAHGVELLGAWRLRRAGATVPAWLQAHERVVRATALSAPVVLERIRTVVDGPMILFKGPEIAHLYPDHARAYGDVDLLVPDAREAQRKLIDAGFVEVSDPELFVDIHHLRPLIWPSLPIKIELHTRLKWPDGLSAPTFEDVVSDARPSYSMPNTILTLSPAHNSVAIAAHAWAHTPLRALRDMIDLAAVTEGVDRPEAAAFARDWGLGSVYRTSLDATDALFAGGTTVPLSLWARHLPAVRERTVLEAHLEQVLSPFWTFPGHRAAPLSLRQLVGTVRLAEGDSTRDKLRRAGLALRHAFAPRSVHDGALGPAASRWRRTRGR